MKHFNVIFLYILIVFASSNLDAHANYVGAINVLQYEISRFEITKENTKWLGYGKKQLYCASAGLILGVLLNQQWSGHKKAVLLLIAGFLHYPAVLNFFGQYLLDEQIELRRKQIERLEIEAGIR